MRVIVGGGGVVGVCCAYFLSRAGIDVRIIERSGVACAASGKSGGFLARDWNDQSLLSDLANRSYHLHETLAETGGREWGYRPVETLSVAASANRDLSSFGRGPLPNWISPKAALQAQIGEISTTAQVNPACFTAGMMDMALKAGARLETGIVEALELSPDESCLRAVRVDNESLETDAAIVAMGPWSSLKGLHRNLPPISGRKGNSLVFKSQTKISAHALFADVEMADGSILSPEIYPRTDGTIYVCGMGNELPLTESADTVYPDEPAIARLRDAALCVVPSLDKAEIIATQACYRPITQDGLPVIGPIGSIDGAFVATGHSVWGILNAPATGEALAQLITLGHSEVDLTPFFPLHRVRS